MFTKSEADAENDDKGASFRLSSSLSSSFSKHQNPSASCPTTLYPRGTGKGKTGVASAAGVEGGACHGVLHSEQYATEERFRNVHMWHAHFPVDDVAPVDMSTRAGVDEDEDDDADDDAEGFEGFFLVGFFEKADLEDLSRRAGVDEDEDDDTDDDAKGFGGFVLVGFFETRAGVDDDEDEEDDDAKGFEGFVLVGFFDKVDLEDLSRPNPANTAAFRAMVRFRRLS